MNISHRSTTYKVKSFVKLTSYQTLLEYRFDLTHLDDNKETSKVLRIRLVTDSINKRGEEVNLSSKDEARYLKFRDTLEEMLDALFFTPIKTSKRLNLSNTPASFDFTLPISFITNMVKGLALGNGFPELEIEFK